VNNSPTNYTDPTGHGVDCGIGMGCVTPYNPPSGGNNRRNNIEVNFDLPKPDTLPCGGILNCNEPSFDELIPLIGPDVCEFLLANGHACDTNTWSSFLDPHNPYSLNDIIPGFQWDSKNVSWITVYVDAIGISGDLLPVLQPGAEGVEVVNFLKYIGKWHNGLGLGLDEVDFLNTYVFQENEQFDWVNLGLDSVSLVPEVGIGGSIAGLVYNLGKGIDPYNNLDALYGLPTR
jgi:hypothetical protein